MRTGTQSDRETFLTKVLALARTGEEALTFWADVEKWDYVAGGAPHGGDTVSAVLVEREGNLRHAVSTVTVAQGFSKLVRDEMVSKRRSTIPELPTRTRERFLTARQENDLSALDAEDADMIVQLGVFGEIKY